jgi:hypothetical protein
MKFKREKLDLPTGVAVFFTESGTDQEGELEPFQIIANRRGVRFEGKSPTLESIMDLDAFAKTVSEAWKDHLALKPTILRTGAGH